ncbi:dynamin family protein [Allochromatium tepidum]|uniref:Dynamin N-terminal domain-containing protein n=1 Tax=Allochromatium tepidum TaxID=553982 RepID=A0ABM7QQL8_9GAMM|nr:dynamin family protein [Allochromatium tepidum]BCU08304.1 hypothetical protein Atep_29810 [Allochromatium tepidum]
MKIRQAATPLNKPKEEIVTPVNNIQQNLSQQLPEAQALFARHSFDAAPLEALAPLIADFRLRVPLVGAFSSGKSSLINALIGTRLLATDTTPKTAVPTEIAYGTEPRLTACFADGHREPLTEEAVRDNRLPPLAPEGWIEIEWPAAALATRRRLILVDLPGWDSGIAAHEKVIDHYAPKSVAYCVAVSVDEGTLRASLRPALRELAIQDMPVVLVLTKADKKPADTVAAVASQVQEEVAELMGRPPLAVAVTSASPRASQTTELAAALDTLTGMSERIFTDRVVVPYRGALLHAAQQLEVLANQENHDAPKLQAQIDALENELKAFEARLERDTAALQEQVGPILGAIRLRVENALLSRLDSLASRAMNGDDISDDILGTARLVVADNLRQEFAPALQRYLDRLVDALPSRLDLPGLENIKLTDSDSTGEFRWKSLGATLAAVVMKIPYPLAKIVAPLLPILGHLLDSRADQERRALEAARQREAVKGQIHSALSRAVKEIEASLRPVLEEQVQRAQSEIKRQVESEQAEVRKNLETLINALQQGEAETAALRERARADLEQLQVWLGEIAQSTPGAAA